MKKGMADGLKVTVHFPDGKVIEYSGDKGDQIIVSVNKSGETDCHGLAVCSNVFFVHALSEFLKNNLSAAREIVQGFIVADIPRMLRERSGSRNRELTLDALLAEGEDDKKGTVR